MRRAIVYAAAVGALLIWPPLVLIFFCCCRPSVQQLMESDPEGMRRRSPGRRGSPAAWRRLIASRAPVPQAKDAENYDRGQHRSAKE